MHGGDTRFWLGNLSSMIANWNTFGVISYLLVRRWYSWPVTSSFFQNPLSAEDVQSRCTYLFAEPLYLV
jgi:hypothetical protein